MRKFTNPICFRVMTADKLVFGHTMDVVNGYMQLGGIVILTQDEIDSNYSTGRFSNYLVNTPFPHQVGIPLVSKLTGDWYLNLLQNISGRWSFIGRSSEDYYLKNSFPIIHFELEEDALMFKMSL